MITYFKSFFTVLIITAALTMFSAFAHAQSTTQDNIDVRQTRISAISKSIEEGTVNLTEARGALRLIRSESRNAIETLSKQKSNLEAQLNSLGTAPEAGKSEPSEIAQRRLILTTDISRYDTLIAQARLNETDANRQLNELIKTQRSSFRSDVLTPQKSIFSPTLWNEVGGSTLVAMKIFPKHISQWKTDRKTLAVWKSDKFKLLTLFLLIAPLLFLSKIKSKNYIAAKQINLTSNGINRYSLLALHILSSIIPFAIALGFIYQILVSSEFIHPNYIPSFRVAISCTLLLIFSRGIAEGLFNPSVADWRVIPLSDNVARTAKNISIISVALLSFGWIMASISSANPDLKHLSNAGTAIITIGVSIIAFISVFKINWQLLESRSDEISLKAKQKWDLINKGSLPFTGLALAALTFGYLHLAYFISVRVILLAGLFLGIWILRRYLIKNLNRLDKNFSSKIPGVKTPSRQAMLFWAGLFIDAFILLSLIPILFLTVGVDTYSVRTGMIDAFTGITIGNIQFSIADILAAIATFFIIFFITRFLQRTLDTRLFEKSGADIGFRNSFRTLLGYVGLIIAIFASIGVVGLDLSNLAIIAGALSVGIGFGLQSIVNNFVSGLILLFERPVKVGDWVVTKSGEGVVKQISVRSTEIETFDRASIIVPNSELISSSVTNWTHKNKVGRIVIPIGVGYDSDAKHVRKVLIQTATEHPKVLSDPAPFVYFKEFGDSSLDLELRVFIQNVSEGSLVKNDLRFDILDIFRKEKIEIPFPQRDVNLLK